MLDLPKGTLICLNKVFQSYPWQLASVPYFPFSFTHWVQDPLEIKKKEKKEEKYQTFVAKDNHLTCYC